MEETTPKLEEEFTAQTFYDRMEELKEQSKTIHEEMNTLMESFSSEFELFEVPIIDKESKPKFIRVYAPEGKYVYNTKWEIGLRAKDQNPLPEE